MKMSIAIPTWESRGRGVEFLDDMFRTIEIQTMQPDEIVISDHSVTDDIEKYCKDYDLPIKYKRNPEKRGNGPANTNEAIKRCSGDIVKVMFQDDFFYDDEALEKIYNSFDEEHDWLLCGSNHTQTDGHSFYWDLYPTWNAGIIDGVNTISSPSVMAAKKKVFDQILFDDNLYMMMDCEIYYHIKKKFGDPIYLHDILVSNRVHSEQLSLEYNASDDAGDKLNKEVTYCKSKHYV